MDGVPAPVEAVALAWPGEETVEGLPELDESFWARSRDFDWGD